MKLDLGCGMKKKHGFTGVDKLDLPGVDIVCDFDKYPLPLPDNSVDEFFSMHFFEHVDNIVQILDEICRVGKNGACINIYVPYYNSIGAYRDPTHVRFFTYDTFMYFTNTKKMPSFYSSSKFKIEKRRILVYPGNSNFFGKLRFAYKLPLQLFVDIAPSLYECFPFRLMPASDLFVRLKINK